MPVFRVQGLCFLYEEALTPITYHMPSEFQTQVLFCGKGKYPTELKQLLRQTSYSGWLALALL